MPPQDKLNKRKVSEEKAAAAKLLSGLTKLFGRLNLGVAGTGNPTPHCLQLMEILGTLQVRIDIYAKSTHTVIGSAWEQTQR